MRINSSRDRFLMNAQFLSITLISLPLLAAGQEGDVMLVTASQILNEEEQIAKSTETFTP